MSRHCQSCWAVRRMAAPQQSYSETVRAGQRNVRSSTQRQVPLERRSREEMDIGYAQLCFMVYTQCCAQLRTLHGRETRASDVCDGRHSTRSGRNGSAISCLVTFAQLGQKPRDPAPQSAVAFLVVVSFAFSLHA